MTYSDLQCHQRLQPFLNQGTRKIITYSYFSECTFGRIESLKLAILFCHDRTCNCGVLYVNFVCQFVGHTGALSKNGWTDQASIFGTEGTLSQL